jgi:hypothetical protein
LMIFFWGHILFNYFLLIFFCRFFFFCGYHEVCMKVLIVSIVYLKVITTSIPCKSSMFYSSHTLDVIDDRVSLYIFVSIHNFLWL